MLPLSHNIKVNYSLKFLGLFLSLILFLQPIIFAATFPATASANLNARQSATATICEGEPQVISVPVLNQINLLYQWQVSTDGGVSWLDITQSAFYANEHSPNLTVIPPLSFNGYQFRCRMSNGLTTGYSAPAMLTVNPKSKIKTQPQPVNVQALESVTFSVEAEATQAAYQWQVNKGEGWVSLTDEGVYSGTTTPTLWVTAAPWYLHQYQYRCIVSGQCGPNVTSEAAALIITDAFYYVNQPMDAITCEGKALDFTVTLADATDFTYQWQESQDGGTQWRPLSEGPPYANVTSSTLQVEAGLPLDNYYYRCLLTKGQDIFLTEPFKLTVLEIPLIRSQATQAVSCAGSNAAFSITATGYQISYQWQVDTGDGIWTDLSNNGVYNGVTAHNLAITGISPEWNGYQYRCLVSGVCPANDAPTPATLTVVGPDTWKGITPGWQEDINWCNGVPTATTNVTIKPGVPHMPSVAAAACQDLTIEAGAVVTMTGAFTINGTPTLSGNLLVGNHSLTLNGGPVQGQAPNLVTGPVSTLVMGGSAAGVYIPAGIAALQSLVINNTSLTGVQLSGNLSLNSLTFQQGKLYLNASTLKMQQSGAIIGADSTRYVVTQDDAETGGYLTQPVLNNETFVSFPVGTANSYSPAQVKLGLLSVPDDVRVRVIDKVFDKGTTGNLVTQSGVNKTWLIEETTPGGSLATVRLGWLNKAELIGFNKTTAKKAHYKNNKWEFPVPLASLLQDNLQVNWLEQGGYTEFSPYAILDQKLSLAAANLKVFLQGPYNASTGKMNTTLAAKNLIPLTQPYQGVPWNYAGTETVAADFFTKNPEVVDWVLLEIRSTSTTKVKNLACFLNSDGSLLAADGLGAPRIEGMSEGNYYLVVQHRNHLPIMSAGATAISSFSAQYDLSNNLQNIYGSEAVTLQSGAAPVLGVFSADANKDGVIDALDQQATWNTRNKSGYYLEDVNLDGAVDALDRASSWNNRNKIRRVPIAN